MSRKKKPEWFKGLAARVAVLTPYAKLVMAKGNSGLSRDNITMPAPPRTNAWSSALRVREGRASLGGEEKRNHQPCAFPFVGGPVVSILTSYE